MWAVIYEHEFGTSVYTRTTEEAAYECAASVIVSWIGDTPDPASRELILSYIIGGDNEKALEAWNGLNENEERMQVIETCEGREYTSAQLVEMARGKSNAQT